MFNALLLNFVDPKYNNGVYQPSTFACYLSLFDTLVIHYIGYFCLIFRAMRIFKIINIEAKFLDNIYDSSFFPASLKKMNVDTTFSTDGVDDSPLINNQNPTDVNEIVNIDQFKVK